jgi:hypothetical protein
VDHPPREPAPPRCLLSGADSRLRVHAVVSGPAAPANPAWKWQVMFEQSTRVDVTTVNGAPDTVDVPVRSPGSYFIRAEAVPPVLRGGSPTDQDAAGSSRSRVHLSGARVTPPQRGSA